MFAYCGNDPVDHTDPSGHAYWGTNTVVLFDGVSKDNQTVDLTDRLMGFMRDNAEIMSDYVEEHGKAKATVFFYQNVTDGGILDIKLQDEWSFEPGVTYVFNGIVLRHDDPGNINFGYVGAVLFSESILCMGAGLNQIKKWGFQFGSIATWYDDPRDNEMIKYGYYLYQEDNP